MDINDPFATFSMGGMGGLGGFHRSFKSHPGGLHRGFEKKKDPSVVHDLKVSLEEVFSGCTKKMKISRKRLNPDGCTMRNEDKILTVDIKRGWKEGTKITFPREGDETPTNIPADVVFVVKDKPHPVFKREGSDIIYPAKISLREVSDSNFTCLMHQIAKIIISRSNIGRFSCSISSFFIHSLSPSRHCVDAQSAPQHWTAGL